MHRMQARPAPLDFPLPHAHTAFGIDRRKDFGQPSSQPPLYLQAPLRDGLHTPPADHMATTYQQRQYSQYGSRPDTYSTPGGVAQGSYAGAYSGSSAQGRQYSAPPPHSSLSQLSPHSGSSTSSSSTLGSESQLFGQTSPQTSNVFHYSRADEELRRKATQGVSIAPGLQIPSSINSSGGSLAEFAAQITCLFWFESAETLKKAENVANSSSPVERLRDEASPSTGFRKWVVTILSTTQVTPNVILLALLFIYRLKTINPKVRGRSGSEYRLLTVALMLGNKFLDDNTYTNKTWAEVSGISVTEIHVMEVEFLSNMRYSLLASKEEWKEWQEKLAKFWIYCDRAERAPIRQLSPQAQQILHPTLPSPPCSMQSSPPSLTSGYPPLNGKSHYGRHHSNGNSHQMTPTSVPAMPEQDLRSLTRKRSYDGSSEESAAKRVTRPATTSAGPASFASNASAIRHDLPRLPVPNLTISTSQPMSSYNGSATSQNVPLLPPLNGRSMSSVYPTTPSWTPNLPVLTPTGPPSQHGPLSAGGYKTPSRRTSPNSHSVQDLLSLGSSPISGSFPYSLGHISPSCYLQQRNSPYKPVRHVNTLLYPPPSASMHTYHGNVDDMQYQPLGRRNDYRHGVVPEYAHSGLYQHYPVLPQPNFHA